jgi:hypothetical protein
MIKNIPSSRSCLCRCRAFICARDEVCVTWCRGRKNSASFVLYHSEKLANSFGFISTLTGNPLHSNHWPLCKALYAIGLDACLYRDKLKWHKAYPHKLVAGWMTILLTFLISYVSWMLANIMTETSCCFQRCDRNSRCRYCTMVSKNLRWIIIYLSIPLSKADEVSE